jgi:hypothetical protein
MGGKIKHRQQRKPRNLIAKDMILRGGDGPMKDRRDKRPKDYRNSWSKDWEDDG